MKSGLGKDIIRTQKLIFNYCACKKLLLMQSVQNYFCEQCNYTERNQKFLPSIFNVHANNSFKIINLDTWWERTICLNYQDYLA